MPKGKKFVADVELSLIDRLTAPFRKMLRNFDALTKAGKAASKAFEVAANLKHSADNIKGFSDEIASVVKKPIKTFMDFEKQMSKVRAATFNGVLTDETRKQFEDLSATARKLGADTQFSGQQAAEGMEILATQGFDAAGQIAAMRGILDVAAASTESIADSAAIATAAMNQFGLKAGDMGRIGDVLIKTANSSSTGLLDIGEAMKYAGTEASKAGVSLEKTTAMIGVLGDAGVKGSMAGTALRAMLSGFQAPSKQGKSALAFLGINVKDKKGNLKPIEDLLVEMDKSLDKKFGAGKGGTRRAALLKAIFGEEAKSAAGILIDKAGAGDLQKAIAANMAAAGTAKAVADDVSNNAAGAAANLDSALEELQLTIGERLIPKVTELLKWGDDVVTQVSDWAKANPELVRTLGMIAGSIAAVGFVVAPVLKGVSALVTIFGALRWLMAGPLVTALEVVGVALKGIAAWAIANPVTAAIAAIAVAATLIYTYWEPIGEFFVGLWESVTAGFKAALDWIMGKIEWAGEKIRQMTDFLKGQESYTNAGAAAGRERLLGLSDTDLQALQGQGGTIGEQAREALTSRRKSLAEAPAVAASASKVVSGIYDALPAVMPVNGPAANGPMLPEVRGEASQAAQAAAAGDWPGASKFSGDLKITVNGEGAVTKTSMRSAGDPGFVTRVNTGAQ